MGRRKKEKNKQSSPPPSVPPPDIKPSLFRQLIGSRTTELEREGEVLKEAWLNMGGPAKYIKRMTKGTNDVTKWTGVKVEGGRVTGIVWIKQGFTERISPEFARVKKLDKLIISFNKLRGRIPKELAELKHLRMLFLNNNELELRDVPKEVRKGRRTLCPRGARSNSRSVRVRASFIASSRAWRTWWACP